MFLYFVNKNSSSEKRIFFNKELNLILISFNHQKALFKCTFLLDTAHFLYQNIYMNAEIFNE